MKKLFVKIKDKILSFIKWLWAECKDWHTLVLLAVVCLVIGLPVWGGYLVGLVFRWEWAFWVATVTWGFWMLPGAPFFTVSVTVTLAIKRIYEKRQEKKRKKMQDPPSEDHSDPTPHPAETPNDRDA